MISIREDITAQDIADILIHKNYKLMSDDYIKCTADFAAEVLNSKELHGGGEAKFLELQAVLAMELARRELKYKWKLNRSFFSYYPWKEKDEMRVPWYYQYEKRFWL